MALKVDLGSLEWSRNLQQMLENFVQKFGKGPQRKYDGTGAETAQKVGLTHCSTLLTNFWVPTKP